MKYIYGISIPVYIMKNIYFYMGDNGMTVIEFTMQITDQDGILYLKPVEVIKVK